MFSPGDRHIGEVAFVVLGIGAAQEDLSAHGTVGVAVQIEAEHGVLNTFSSRGQGLESADLTDMHYK